MILLKRSELGLRKEGNSSSVRVKFSNTFNRMIQQERRMSSGTYIMPRTVCQGMMAVKEEAVSEQ